MSSIQPSQILLHKASKTLEVTFESGEKFSFPSEFLRVHSPSAEVAGHGGTPGTLPISKEEVAIVSIDAVGNYAVRLFFDDGHNTGIYSWSYLHDLGKKQEQLWKAYLAKVAAQ